MIKRKLLKEEILLIPEETLDTFRRFVKAGHEIYLVGAGVRAVLQGKVPKDSDFTTNADPEKIQEIVKDLDPFYDNAYGTVGIPIERQKVKGKGQNYSSHPPPVRRAGMAGLEDEVYEITPYRTEQGYSDRRRPDEVTWGDSLKEDVRRRDFTMNSVVIGPIQDSEVRAQSSGYELIDHLGGLEDFEKKIVRAVGDADKRFSEDALRMMRAIRFAAQLSFAIEENTLAGITKNAYLLKEISRERVRDELMKIMKSNHPADGVHLLVTSDLMRYIIPKVLDARGVPQTGHHTLDVYSHMLESLRNCPSPDPIVRLATFLHDIGKPKSRRLRCGNCGWVMKEDSLAEKGDTAKTTQYKCPKCGKLQTEHQAGTFYGHEVVGARIMEEVAKDLKFSNKEREKMVTLVRWHMFAYDTNMTDAAIRRFIKRVGKDNISDMISLRVGDRKGGGSKPTSWRLEEFQKRIHGQLHQPMTVSDLVVDGKDVMKLLKIKPGPKIGEIMNQLFEEVMEESSKNNKEYLMKRIEELG